MSKGAKTQTSKTTVPKYQEQAFKDLYAMGRRVSSQPYTPYTGEMFADRNPLQIGAMNTAVGMSNLSLIHI